MKKKSKMFLWKYFLCSLGVHQDKNGFGLKEKLCEACNQTNPNAYKNYRIKLKDGGEFKVRAVNLRHAESIVIFGGDIRLNENSHMPLDVIVHPAHIASVEVL